MLIVCKNDFTLEVIFCGTKFTDKSVQKFEAFTAIFI